MDNIVLWFYNFIFHTLFLITLPVILAATPFVKRFRQGFFNYFGLLSPAQRKFASGVRNSGGRFYVIHGVSVGEIKLASSVMEQIIKRDPNAYFALTSTSPDSFKAASDMGIAGKVMPLYFPLDIPLFWYLFFKVLNPRAIYILEVDIWPNFIIAAAVRKVPLYLLNGRISDKTFKFYSRLRVLSRSLFSLFDLCFMQTPEDKKRIIALGAEEKYCAAAGNMKFDTAISPAAPAKIVELKEFIKNNFGRSEYGLVFCAASTHADEEEIFFDAVTAARAAAPGGGNEPKILLIIAPRKVARAAEIRAIIRAKNASCKIAVFNPPGEKNEDGEVNLCGVCGKKPVASTRSAPDGGGEIDVLIIAAMGYLSAAYSFSDAAFVGGTLSAANVGGHNIIEPAAFAIPVIFGTGIRNFKDVASLLLRSPNVFMVSNGGELKTVLEKFFDPHEKNKLEAEGRYLLEIISANSKVTEKIFYVIDTYRESK